jgi:hypothetical protein
MTRKFLLMSLISLGSWCSGYAQNPGDPAVSSIGVSTPAQLPTATPLQIGQESIIEASFGNGSSTAIPASATATYTLTFPPNIKISTTSIVPAAPLTTILGTYNPATGTVVTLVANGDIPASANYTISLTAVAGLSTTTPVTMTINAAGTGLTGNNSLNDNASAQFTVLSSSAGPLPVALVSFTAKLLENQTVELAWTTSLETDNKGFLIERTKDLKTYEKVGEVSELAPLSDALKMYKLVDQHPYPGTSYYRLTQTDLTGKTTTFPVVSVVLRDEVYGVFPNPVVSEGRFWLRLDEPETARVGFYGADGRALSLQKAGVQSGNLLLRTTDNLSTGVYVLTVEERGQTRQHRIIIE